MKSQCKLEVPSFKAVLSHCSTLLAIGAEPITEHSSLQDSNSLLDCSGWWIRQVKKIMSGEKTWCAGRGIKPHTEGGSFKLDSRLCCIVTKCMNPLKTQDQPPWLPVLVSLFGQSSRGSYEGLWRSISGSWGATDHVLNESWSEGMRLELVRTGGAGSHLKRVRCGLKRAELHRTDSGYDEVEKGGWSFKSLVLHQWNYYQYVKTRLASG